MGPRAPSALRFTACHGRTLLKTFLGLDVGNTRLSAAIVATDGRVLSLHRCDAPASADEAIEALMALAGEAMNGANGRPHAAGIGFGGPVDTRTGEIRVSFLSSGWEGRALGRIISERLGITTWLANDADAGGLAEAKFGAGRGVESLLYVNVGTGVGGAVMLNGDLYLGATSSAGEIGHMVVRPGGPLCECGKRGCLQAQSSGTAIARRAREMLAESGAGSALAEIAPEDVSGARVGEAALNGDVLANEVVGEAAKWLGLALANAAHLLDPERIVVGGGVADLGDAFLQPARASYRSHIFGSATDTEIVRAELGYDAGVIGAAVVAMVGAGARSEP